MNRKEIERLRNDKIVEFLEEFKVATTSTIHEIIFRNDKSSYKSTLRTAQYKLKRLSESKKNSILGRERYNINNEYIYWIKGQKPKQLQHRLLISDFYRELHKLKDVKIHDFITEVSIGNVRADGLVGFAYRNKNFVFFIEVQRSNCPLDIEKYEKLKKSNEYKKILPVFPDLIAITNKRIPNTEFFKIVKIKQNLSNVLDLLNFIEKHYFK